MRVRLLQILALTIFSKLSTEKLILKQKSIQIHLRHKLISMLNQKITLQDELAGLNTKTALLNTQITNAPDADSLADLKNQFEYG